MSGIIITHCKESAKALIKKNLNDNAMAHELLDTKEYLYHLESSRTDTVMLAMRGDDDSLGIFTFINNEHTTAGAYTIVTMLHKGTEGDKIVRIMAILDSTLDIVVIILSNNRAVDRDSLATFPAEYSNIIYHFALLRQPLYSMGNSLAWLGIVSESAAEALNFYHEKNMEEKKYNTMNNIKYNLMVPNKNAYDEILVTTSIKGVHRPGHA